MKKQLRSSSSTQGRRMAGARALWAANGMKKEQMGKPIIAIVNSFTQFVPGHVHLHEIGQQVKTEIEKLEEMKTLIENLKIDARFVTDGASNLIQVRGNLKTDKQKMIAFLKQQIAEQDEAYL